MSILDEYKKLTDHWKSQHKHTRWALRFLSGDQWDSRVVVARMGRPLHILNMTKAYVDRVVNPLRASPVSLQVSHPDPRKEFIANGLLSAIENRSKAYQHMAKAFEHAVTGGIGWLRVDVVEDDFGEDYLSISSPEDPTTIQGDVWALRSDGADYSYASVVGFCSKEYIEEEYPNTPEAISSPHGVFLNVPQGSVPEIYYYEREYNKNKGWQVVVSKVVGSYEIAKKETWDTPYIPIVPIIGDRYYAESGGHPFFTGICHRGRSGQELINAYSSNAAELAALSPKTPFIMAEGQAEGHEDEWDNANTEARSRLEYKPTSVNGQPLPPPQRADNRAQTDVLEGMKQGAITDMARLVGIPDMALGGRESEFESGTAITSRMRNAELGWAQYLDNATGSYEQVGNVVVSLFRDILGGKVRKHILLDSDGTPRIEEFDVAEIFTPEDIAIMKVSTKTGPSFDSRRAEAHSALNTMMQMLGPEKAPILMDYWVETLDIPNAKAMAERVRQLLPPEMRNVGKGDQMLNAKQLAQQVQMLQQQIQQVGQTADQAIKAKDELLRQAFGALGDAQRQLLSKDNEVQAKIFATKVESFTEIEKAKILTEGKLEVESIKKLADAQQEVLASIKELRTQYDSMGYQGIQDPQLNGGFEGELGAVGNLLEVPDVSQNFAQGMGEVGVPTPYDNVELPPMGEEQPQEMPSQDVGGLNGGQ